MEVLDILGKSVTKPFNLLHFFIVHLRLLELALRGEDFRPK